MKILLCNSSFGGGGITSYAHEVVKCFKDRCEITVMVGNDSQNPVNYDGVKVYNYEMNDTSVSNAQKVLKVINEEIRPDVLINSNAYLISLLAPYLANNIKLLSVSHALMYNDADVAGFNAQYQDAIIALSLHGKEYIVKRFGIQNAEKVKVVSNCVQDNNSHEEWLKGKKTNKKLTIVFSGGGSAVKSPDIAARVVKELLKTDLEFRFFWLGSTLPPLHKINILKDIKQLFKADERLVFTGKVSREEAKRIIGEANIFLFPSIREGCPMSLLEAMSIGTIPLVADFPQVNIEIIEDGKNGYIVNHKKPEAFAELIKSIIVNHCKYLEIYERSYQSYKERFCYPVWVDNMNMVIRELGTEHLSRHVTFNEGDYKQSEKKFLKMLKKDTVTAYRKEAVPVALSLIKEYLKSKIS